MIHLITREGVIMKNLISILLLMTLVACGSPSDSEDTDNPNGSRIETGNSINNGSSRLAQTLADKELCSVNPFVLEDNDFYREHVTYRADGTFLRFYMNIYTGYTTQYAEGFWGADEFSVQVEGNPDSILYDVKIDGNKVNIKEVHRVRYVDGQRVEIEVESLGIDFRTCDGSILRQ
jgi:hypothetical protein